MLNINMSDMLLNINTTNKGVKSDNSYKKDTLEDDKSIGFTAYIDKNKKDSIDSCSEEINEDIEYEEIDVVDDSIDTIKDILSIIGLNNNIVIEDDTTIELGLDNLSESFLSDNVGLENILVSEDIKDLDVLNNILGENNDISLDYIEYDYIEKENITLDDIVPSNVLVDTAVSDVDVVINKDKVSNSPIIVNQDTFVDDMLSNIDYMTKEGIQRLKLQLSPKDLGDMVIEIVKTSDSSKMVLTLSKEDLYSVVQNNIKELNSQLSVLNIKVDEISVELKTDLNNGFMAKDAENKSNSNKGSKGNKNKREVNSIDDIVSNKVVNIIKDDKVLMCV